MRGIRLLAVGALIVAPLTLSASSAEASLVPTVPTCGMFVTSSVKLTSDLMCTNGVALHLGDGGTYTVDLNGHTITSTDPASIGIDNLGRITIENGTLRLAGGTRDHDTPTIYSRILFDGGGIFTVGATSKVVSSTFIHGASWRGTEAGADAEHDTFIGDGTVPYAIGEFEDSITAIGNTIAGFDVGIDTTDSGTVDNIVGNHIERTRIGISIGGTGFGDETTGSISKNTIQANSGDGIYLGSGSGDSGNLSVTKNTVSLNGGDGIHVDATDVDAVDGHGLIDVTLSQNKLTLNAGLGIELPALGTAGVTINDGGGNTAKQNVNGGCSAGIACS